MRLFEVTIIILLLVFFAGRLYNIASKTKNTLMVAIVAVLLLHISLEGVRWQLTIVYLLSLVLLFKTALKIEYQIKWLRITATIVSILLIITSLVMAYILPVFTLPALKGDYYVGASTHTINTKDDTGIIDIKTWYPITKVGQTKDVYCKTPYTKLNGLMGMPGFLYSHLNLVKTGSHTSGAQNANPTKFPLVVYAHGAASTNIDNTAMLQEIASHGYIVVALDFNFSFKKYNLSLKEATTLEVSAQQKFVDKLVKRAVPIQSKKMLAVINHLKTKSFAFCTLIDFNQIALIGHSLGGTTSINIDTKKLAPQAIVNIDGPMPYNASALISCPFLYISSYSPSLSNKELIAKGLPNPELYRQIKQEELKGVSRFYEDQASIKHWVRFNTAGHLDFTDLPYIIPIMASNGYNKEKGHYLKCKLILNFLDCYLKKEAVWTNLNNTSINWLE